MNEDKKNDRDEFMIDLLVKYQQATISRRWQYYGAYAIIVGILLNAYVQGNSTDDQKRMLCLLGVGLSLVSLQFVSVAAVRLEKTQKRLRLEHSTEVIDIPLDGRFSMRSVTTLLYFSIILIAATWLFLIPTESRLLFLILTIASVINLIFLRWVPPKFLTTSSEASKP